MVKGLLTGCGQHGYSLASVLFKEVTLTLPKKKKFSLVQLIEVAMVEVDDRIQSWIKRKQI